jgi:hypothetical protein
MKASWKFIAGLGAGLALTFALTVGAFCLNLGIPTDTSGWASELNQKKRLLAEQTASPKLLLVGGSGTLFGLSAREIEQQTGWRTVNLGTHGVLGPTYILHLARAAAKPGDTVLLVLEYEFYNHGKIDQTWTHRLLVDYIISRDPAFFHQLTLGERWTLFMLTSNSRLLQGLKNRLRPEPPYNDEGLGVYSVRNLNEWGDLTHHTAAHRFTQRDAIRATKSVLGRGLPEDARGLAPIEAFCRWAQTNQIHVLATFPNLCDEPEYHGPVAQHTVKLIEDFYARLGVPVIGCYTDALLPEEQLLDTMYHPTEEAALDRTQHLIPKLKAALK